jgi:AraC-like DNA-binding protein
VAALFRRPDVGPTAWWVNDVTEERGARGWQWPADERAPFCAETIRFRKVHAPAAFDWVEVMAVRRGTGRVFKEDQRPVSVRPGDAVFLVPRALCAIEPEGEIEFTRILFDEEYLIEQIRWQYLRVAPDMPTARRIAMSLHPVPWQVVHLDGDELEWAAQCADGLAGLTAGSRLIAEYYRAVSLATGLLSVVSPKLKRARPRLGVPRPLASRRATLVSPQGARTLSPPVLKVRDYIEAHCRERFTEAELAQLVSLSPSWLRRVFHEQTGKTLFAFRDSIRVQLMVRLLAETDLPVARVASEVGFTKPERASAVFARSVGKGPSAYRRWFRSEVQTGHRTPRSAS